MFEELVKNQYFNEVVKFLKARNFIENSYLVGGTVRDLLLGKEVKDIDFAIKGDSLSLAKDFAKIVGGSFVLLDEAFSIGRVVKEDITIDFADLRGGSIEADLSGRDFTINAIATDLSLSKIIDPFGGQEDLKNKTIKMINEENLKTDSLRILRAYRFNATLNFNIDEPTREALRKNANLIKLTARERIKEELWKIISVNESIKTVEIMVEDDIFSSIFKFSNLLPIKPSLKALRITEEVLNNPEKIFTSCKIPQSAIACLKFTALFNFQASYLIKQIVPSKKEDRFVEKLIEANIRLKKIETLLDKVNFLKNYENILYPALICGISHDPFGIARSWFYREIEQFYKKVYLKNKKKLPIIKGDDILALGFEPSPVVGEILERIETLVLAGKISKKEEALEEIKNRYLLKISSP